MEESEIKRILSAPIELLRPLTKQEEKRYGEQDKWSYLFQLKSGPSFVGQMAKEEEHFTFKSLHNRLPGLLFFEWKKRTKVDDLGYDTFCYVGGADFSPLHPVYEKALSPKPIKEGKFPVTKIAFQHYEYPAMLERAVCIRNKLMEQEMLRKLLDSSQEQLNQLMISPKGINRHIQQKIKERRQKNG